LIINKENGQALQYDLPEATLGEASQETAGLYQTKKLDQIAPRSVYAWPNSPGTGR
jgi:hypothetical protein